MFLIPSALYHGLKSSPKSQHGLDCVLQMSVDTHCCTRLLTSSTLSSLSLCQKTLTISNCPERAAATEERVRIYLNILGSSS